MDEETKEELLQALEGAVNFMRGMAIDTRLLPEHIDALRHKASAIDAVFRRHLDT